MNPLRILLVDDEALARQRLRDLLARHSCIQICGESSTATAAIEQIETRSPDVLFLDVQMPDGSGFDVLRAVGPDSVPVVVFTTAYDQYALQAFEAHALDYLLKPFSDQRFEEALSRACRMLTLSRERNLVERLEALLEDAPKSDHRLVVRSSGRVNYLDPSEIEWVEAEGNYVLLHTARESHLHRETMTSIESRLPPGKFLRIHRSSIVQLALVREVLRSREGDHDVRLASGKKLRVSPRHRQALLDALGE